MKYVYLEVHTIIGAFSDNINKFSVKLSFIDRLKILFSNRVWFGISDKNISRF